MTNEFIPANLFFADTDFSADFSLSSLCFVGLWNRSFINMEKEGTIGIIIKEIQPVKYNLDIQSVKRLWSIGIIIMPH